MHSDIVHPESSSQLTEARNRVRSFGVLQRYSAARRPGAGAAYRFLPARVTALRQNTTKSQ